MAADRIWLETLRIRLRAKLRTLVRLCGVGMVLLVVFNVFAAPLFDMGVIAPYREWGAVMTQGGRSYFIGDVLLLALGLVMAWFV